MKKILYTALAVLALSGCSKDKTKPTGQSEDISDAKIINFNVSDLSLSSERVGTNSVTRLNALKDQIKYLHYAVFRGKPGDQDFAHQLRKQLVQTSDDPNFGSITDTLYSKRYGIYFVGANTPGQISASEIHGSGGSYVTDPVYSPNTPTLSKDLYYAKIDTTVSSAFTKSVVMKRMVSVVTIQINDNLPLNADKIVVSYGDYPPGFDLAIGEGRPRVREDPYFDADFTYQINASDLGKSNYSVSTVVWPYSFFNITISCYDKTGKLISSKSVPKNSYDTFVKINRNTHYTYRGSLFAQTGTFGVSIDTSWNSPINVPFDVKYPVRKVQ